MQIMTDTKQILRLLREVKKEKNYSLDQIMKLIEDNGDFVSKSTLSRLFGDNSDDFDFRYETTIRPVADALLDLEEIEPDDDPEKRAVKSILKLKRDIIDELRSEIEQTKVNYAEKLQEEADKFQRSLDYIKHQVELKDQRIDTLLTQNAELTAINKDITATNNQLVKQMMNCPLKKQDGKEAANGDN